MIAEILLCIFLLSIVVQFGYVLLLFCNVFSPGTSTAVINNRKPVSVIICAKNEAGNLRQNLPAILAQRYMNDAGNPMFEVIVVNDASEDDTQLVLEQLQNDHPHLKIIHIATGAERPLPGKKTALHRAVATAANDLLLMTDADCQPQSADWISHMAAPLHAGREVVTGYGKLKKTGGWLNGFIRWETMHTFLQYSSYALAGQAYMGVGRNIACTKQAFLKAQSSEAWAKLPSGDDDLLVNAVADKDNVAVVSAEGSFTLSAAKENWHDWVAQKQRHVSTAKYYKLQAILLLGGYACIHALVWLLFFLLLIVGDAETALIAMSLRCAVYWLVWYEAARKTGEKDLWPSYLLMDIGWMIYNFAFSPYIFWKNKRQWK